MTCYLTDAEWLLENLKNGETLDRLSGARMPADRAAVCGGCAELM